MNHIIYSFTTNYRTYKSTDFDKLLSFAYWMGVAGVWELAGECETEISLEANLLFL